MCVCICWSTCQYGSICVYVCDKYVHIYTYIYIQYMSCTFMSCTSIDLLTNLHTSESIYIPIHTQNTHWFTYVCHEKFIFLRDSMMKKITKNSRELAVWRVSTSQIFFLRLTPQNKSLRRPCGASRCARLRLGLRFGSVFGVRSGNRTELQPLSSVRLEYRGRTLPATSQLRLTKTLTKK